MIYFLITEKQLLLKENLITINISNYFESKEYI